MRESKVPSADVSNICIVPCFGHGGVTLISGKGVSNRILLVREISASRSSVATTDFVPWQEARVLLFLLSDTYRRYYPTSHNLVD